MATVLALNWYLRMSVWAVDGAQASDTSFYYQVTGPATPTATDQDASDVFDNAVSALYKPILNANATYRGTVTQIIWPLPIKVDVFSTLNAGAGTGGSPALPKQVAGLSSWYTALAGRANRGRTYWPFPSAAHDTGDGVPTAAYITALAALNAGIPATLSVSVGGRLATLTRVLWHRALKSGTPITASIARSAWATQRRRGAYGRTNSAPL